jgi:hypothetical protein
MRPKTIRLEKKYRQNRLVHSWSRARNNEKKFKSSGDTDMLAVRLFYAPPPFVDSWPSTKFA